MEELKHKLELESCSFPKLLTKHLLEIENSEDSEILYHRQAHEIYMYTFFRNLKFDCISQIKIDSIDGYSISNVKLNSIQLGNSIAENEFFDKLLFAPYPFIFVPNCDYSQVKNFCNGALSFKGEGLEGVLMDLSFASKVGIDFVAVDFLQREDIAFLFIGIVYRSEQNINC
jgi:hypothetical protein